MAMNIESKSNEPFLPKEHKMHLASNRDTGMVDLWCSCDWWTELDWPTTSRVALDAEIRHLSEQASLVGSAV